MPILKLKELNDSVLRSFSSFDPLKNNPDVIMVPEGGEGRREASSFESREIRALVKISHYVIGHKNHCRKLNIGILKM